MASWSGRYDDRRGSEPVSIHNDGRMLTVEVRGVEFCGEDFDALEPVAGATATEGHFDLFGGFLCSYVLEWDVPLPVVVAGEAVAGVLHCRLLVGSPGGPHGGIDTEELTVALQLAESVIATDRPYGWFEDALASIHRQLPADVHVKACIACAWSDYQPGGQPLFGGMACFRDVKDEYRRVSTKVDIFGILDRRSGWVQETFLCDQFERRGEDAGYRGSFPGPPTR